MKTDINTTDTALGSGKGQDNQVEDGSAYVSDEGQATSSPGHSAPAVEFDPVANVFPMIEGKEFDDLVEDIKVNGLSEPIWTHDGKIIDGRNRYRACLKAGVQPIFRDWVGENSIAFVISANLRRRHLTTSQRAVVAANLATLRKGERSDTQNCASVTVPQAAKALNVSPRTVNQVHAVQKNGVCALLGEIKAGYLSASKAAQIAKEPPAVQAAILAERKTAIKPESQKKTGSRSVAISSGAAHPGQPNSKDVSELGQHLMLAFKLAKQCRFGDLEATIKKARRLFEKQTG